MPSLPDPLYISVLLRAMRVMAGRCHSDLEKIEVAIISTWISGSCSVLSIERLLHMDLLLFV
jgi:hypothetical protein